MSAWRYKDTQTSKHKRQAGRQGRAGQGRQAGKLKLAEIFKRRESSHVLLRPPRAGSSTPSSMPALGSRLIKRAAGSLKDRGQQLHGSSWICCRACYCLSLSLGCLPQCRSAASRRRAASRSAATGCRRGGSTVAAGGEGGGTAQPVCQEGRGYIVTRHACR